jgi:hypothetical protein
MTRTLGDRLEIIQEAYRKAGIAVIRNNCSTLSTVKCLEELSSRELRAIRRLMRLDSKKRRAS